MISCIWEYTKIHWNGHFKWVNCGYHSKVAQFGWMQQQKCIFLPFRGLWRQDQGVSRAAKAASAPGISLRLGETVLSLCPHVVFSLYMSVSASPPLIWTLVIGLRLTLMTHFNFIILMKTLSPNMVTFWDTGVKTSTYQFWVDIIQPLDSLFLLYLMCSMWKFGKYALSFPGHVLFFLSSISSLGF